MTSPVTMARTKQDASAGTGSAARADDPIVVENLSKTYPNGTQALKGISFRVHKGEIFGILGPNGAGKSTAIGILGTLVRPTGGKAIVSGLDVTHDPMRLRAMIGFAMQDAGVDDLATGREFLELQGRLYGVDKKTIHTRADQLFKLFELEDASDKRIKGYSGGMKRRIDLAAALIHLPKLLFLDEPTEGLDPRSRLAMWNTLKRLRDRLGATILLSTHFMDEADQLCDRLAIIDQGKIVAIDTPTALKAAVGGQSVIIEYGDMGEARLAQADAVIQKSGLALRTQRTTRELNIYVADAGQGAPTLLRALDEAKLPPTSLRIQQPSLNDVYLKYTGRRIEEAEAKTHNGGEKK